MAASAGDPRSGVDNAAATVVVQVLVAPALVEADGAGDTIDVIEAPRPQHQPLIQYIAAFGGARRAPSRRIGPCGRTMRIGIGQVIPGWNQYGSK